ncbi:Uncharacterised protein [Bordetella pertussis]|nr:Uncharacterised protein [Bordetella pertussis]
MAGIPLRLRRLAADSTSGGDSDAMMPLHDGTIGRGLWRSPRFRKIDAYSGFKRRWLQRPRAGSAGRGAVRAGRTDRGRAGDESQRRLELPDPEPAADGAHRCQRLHLRQRHAVRLRARRPDRPDGCASRPGGVRHQQRRQHGRRHALFRHGGRGQRGLPVRHPLDRLLADRKRLAAHRIGRARRPPGGRAPDRAAAGRAGPAQRQYPQSPLRGHERLRRHAAGQAPSVRAGGAYHHALWRHGVLGRPGRPGRRRHAGDGLPRHGAGAGLGDAAAPGPDPAQPA